MFMLIKHLTFISGRITINRTMFGFIAVSVVHGTPGT